MADKARRDVRGARRDSETGDGAVCSSAGGKKLNFTCTMRAAACIRKFPKRPVMILTLSER